jgi:hypothetical protein
MELVDHYAMLLHLSIILYTQSGYRLNGGVVLQAPMESSSVILRQCEPFPVPAHLTGVADEVAIIEKGIMVAWLNYATQVLIVVASSIEEERTPNDLLEPSGVKSTPPPAFLVLAKGLLRARQIQ